METEPPAPPPAEASAAATDAATTATTDAPPRTRTLLRYAWPKNFNRKLYLALKPGKVRKAYLTRIRRRHGIKPQPFTITLPPKVVRQPWLATNEEGDASTTTPIAPAQPTTDKPKRPGWNKGLNRKVLRAKKPGKEREEYLANFKKQKGIEPKPASPKLVPKNFAWPKGINREEFLAKKPGTERMAYLARYIRKNRIELEEMPAPLPPPRVPIGRKKEPLSHPRCGCFSSEGCASCSRCVELHCTCGLTGHRCRGLCRESRACSCSLTDPTTRCKLCHGCRQPHGFSHCRCVLHQRILWMKRHPELELELTEEEEDACNCFVLAHRHGGASATREKEAKAMKEIERVRRIRRASGFPSSDNIFRSKKITTVLGDDGLDSDFDDGVDEGPESEVLPPSTENVIPRSMTRRMMDPEYNPASYHPLFRSEGCSLLESVEPRGGKISRKATAAFKSGAMQEEICRGLENYAFELDRNATMPPDDLVEFLVYMASIKSSNVGELIGTFEDSAAVAAGIIIEEYMTQLIEDTVVQQRALCPPTEASVQAFTRELLMGFNWQLFQQQHVCSPPDTTDKITALVEKEATLKDKITELITCEFVSTQPRHFDMNAYGEDLSRWVRSAVIIPPYVLTGEMGWQSSTGMETCRSGVKRRSKERRGHEAETSQSTPQIRLSVKASPVHGNPAYKLQFATTLESGHRVEAFVGGLDSKVKAKETISQLSKVVERQEQRLKGTLTAPPPAPGPRPVIRPPPPEDLNDPYASIFGLVRDHFNTYAQQKWKASVDAYLSATMPPRPERAHKQEAAGKRRGHESPLKKAKKQKLASQ